MEKDQELEQYKAEFKANRDSGREFKFRRAELLKALEPRGTWENHNELIKKAELLKGKTRLTKAEAATVGALVDNFKELHDAFFLAGLHATGLLDILDEARRLYKAENRTYARQLGWAPASKKRGKSENHNSIIATYFFHIGIGYTPDAALEHIMKIFELQSRPAAIKLLQREKKRIPTLPLPSIPSEKKCIPLGQKPSD